MDALQFSLFFVALLVGYVLVHLRLMRFEEHLQKLAGIRALDDRLRVLDERLRLLADAVEKVRLEQVVDGLDRLHDDLEGLRDATGQVQQAIVQIPRPDAEHAAGRSAAAADAPHPSAARVAGLVESRLLQLGFRNLRILSDLRSMPAEGDLEVQVECERSGMPSKGRVIVRNGSVLDVAVVPLTQMFP